MIGALDTHELVKDLQAAGFTDMQAEAVTRAVKKAQDLDFSDLATKTDLNELRVATKTDLNELRTATKTDLNELRAATKTDLNELRAAIAAVETRVMAEIARLRTEMADSRAELIKWVVGIAFAQIATIVAILKLFPTVHS